MKGFHPPVKGIVRDIKKSLTNALWDDDAVIMLTLVSLGGILSACALGLVWTSRLAVNITVMRIGDDVLGLVGALFGTGAVRSVALTLTAMGVGIMYVALSLIVIYPVAWLVIKGARVATHASCAVDNDAGFTLIELSLSLVIMSIIMGVTYMSAQPTLKKAHDLVAMYDLSAQVQQVQTNMNNR
jgi:prepilin-type N-terminal cleavage/methylation domain-containing protein